MGGTAKCLTIKSTLKYQIQQNTDWFGIACVCLGCAPALAVLIWAFSSTPKGMHCISNALVPLPTALPKLTKVQFCH